MAVNKIEYGDKVLIDLTSDTVTADKLMNGVTAHKADGTVIVGTMFSGYPDTYMVTDALRDSNGNDILDNSGDIIQGQMKYKRD